MKCARAYYTGKFGRHNNLIEKLECGWSTLLIYISYPDVKRFRKVKWLPVSWGTKNGTQDKYKSRTSKTMKNDRISTTERNNVLFRRADEKRSISPLE